MSEWAPKRFYKDATFDREGDQYVVRLDGKPVRTPGKRLLAMPGEAMARHVAEEWQAQEGKIDPRTMPWTRSANTAIDKVSAQRVEIMEHISGYADTDLLCYRAEGPDTLVERQTQNWDALLDWVTQRYLVSLKVTCGVMPVAQDEETLLTLKATMGPMSDFQLTGFHDLVTLSGSFVIALATVEAVQPADVLWKISRIDENWQSEQWGIDEEAAAAAELKREAFLHAHAFFRTAQ
jgi:chaperone required for assembly of F1-ATPase